MRLCLVWQLPARVVRNLTNYGVDAVVPPLVEIDIAIQRTARRALKVERTKHTTTIPQGGDMFTHMQIATAVALIVGYCAAHAAGLLTRAHAPQWVLGFVTVILATLAGVLPTVVWNQADDWKGYLANVFAALVATTLAHKSQIPTALKSRTGGVVG